MPQSSSAQLIGEIMQAQQRLAHVFAFNRSDPLLAANLTMPQLKVLWVLAINGSASGHDLGDAIGVSLATISGIVDRLCAQELVTRREDPRDRRVRRIELTPSGQELVDSIMVAGDEHQRRLLSRLNVGQLRLVLSAIELMLAAAAEDSADAAGATVRDITGRGDGITGA